MTTKFNSTPAQDPTTSPKDNIGVSFGRIPGHNVFVISIPDDVKAEFAVQSRDRATTLEAISHSGGRHDLSSMTFPKNYNLIKSNRYLLKDFDSKEERNAVICQMYADGMTESEISKLTGIPQTTVSYIIRTWRGKV